MMLLVYVALMVAVVMSRRFVELAYWISSGRHDRVTKESCSCPVCRNKLKRKRPSKDEFPLEDVSLFCRVFPEGVVGDCGFFYDGFCAVFEDGCVRWNELGDKKDYGIARNFSFHILNQRVTKSNVFKSGGGKRGLEK
jgi:hypothetical protein